VEVNNVQVSADLIPIQSQPVRVGGPGVTWLHDTRSPGPLDAVKGQYTTLQTFLASSKFGSQTDFWKIDGTNATYYQFGKQKYVIARSTRIGYEQSSGANPNVGNAACLNPDSQGNDLLNTNASCVAVPLPERLYAGGANSLIRHVRWAEADDPDARRWPPGDCLDVMRQTIITVGGMEAGHGQEMFE